MFTMVYFCLKLHSHLNPLSLLISLQNLASNLVLLFKTVYLWPVFHHSPSVLPRIFDELLAPSISTLSLRVSTSLAVPTAWNAQAPVVGQEYFGSSFTFQRRRMWTLPGSPGQPRPPPLHVSLSLEHITFRCHRFQAASVFQAPWRQVLCFCFVFFKFTSVVSKAWHVTFLQEWRNKCPVGLGRPESRIMGKGGSFIHSSDTF